MSPSSREPDRFQRRYGPWALVTGASEGIGRAFAQALAQRGVHLVLAARREPALQALAAELSNQHGVACRVMATDLGQPGAAQGLLEATRDLPLGLLVASAGFGSAGPFTEGALPDEQQMLAVNCGATLALAHGLAQRFSQQGHGGLVLMSSVVAFQGVPGSAHYAATKAYVQTLAEGLQQELAPHGVDVLACAPGPVHSGFAARAGMRMGLAARPEAVAHGALHALGRRGTCRPGALSWGLGHSLALLPRAWRVRVMAQVMKGMVHRPLPQAR